MNDVVPLLKHTPSAQRPEVLEAITVQREPLVAALVESALDTSGGLRHNLLVGPRGIGKTHILSLVASRIRAADPEARQIVVGWLDEDPWSIRNYGKFLAAITTHAAEATGDEELERAARELRAGVADDEGLRGEELVRRAVGERRLVLLVENLDEIFRRIGTDGQLRFRAFAEDWGRMLVFASTPQLFAGVRQHASPFYGFFAVTHLDELSLESAADLLRRIARLRDDAALLRFLDSDVAMRRLRAIEALAGGHPRVWLLLAGCISVAAIDELVPLFLQALDDLTPYYQDRLRELSDLQQELVVLLSEAGGALSNRELSERSGIPERQVATILKQLTDRGYVRRARVPEDLSVGDRRMSHWELREPLMRLCLDVKQARGEPLRIVVEFLRAWYGPRLLDELNRLPTGAELATEYASEAFRTLETLSGKELMHGTPEEVLARVERGLSLKPNSPSLRVAKVAALLMQGRLTESRDLIEELIAEEPTELSGFGLRLQLAGVRRALGEPFDDVEPLIVEAIERSRRNPESPHAAGLLAFAYDSAGRLDEAAAAYVRAIELDPGESQLFDAYGLVLGKTGRDAEALRAFYRAVETTPNNPFVHDHLGTALSRLGRYDEAHEAFVRATELAPHNAAFHTRAGAALSCLGRYEEALEALTRASELDPGEAEPYKGQAFSLIELDRLEEAVQACDRALTVDPGDPAATGLRGLALARMRRPEEALRAFVRASEIEPDQPAHRFGSASALQHLGRFAEAVEAARQAVALDGEEPVYRFGLADATLASGSADDALAHLDVALALWARDRAMPPGEPEVLCTILWNRYRHDARRRELIERLASAYRRVGALEDLGRGLVVTIPLLLDASTGDEEVTAWVDDWSHAFGEAEIPVQLLQAARDWKRDRDQRHLLALPPEQREILIGMLPRS